MSEKENVKPAINVTPLIDVLLVLLIIFMVISPLKPSTFKANIPSEPDKDEKVDPNPLTLVVTVKPDSTLELNQEKDLGTVAEPGKVMAELIQTFIEREKNGVFRRGSNEVEKTVFIRAPRNLPYGQIARVVDAVKVAGASPIGLQIDRLE